MNKNKNKAFTLIELLVVIVIIGILSGIGISTFKNYQKKARDGKETAECAQIDRCNLLRSTCEAGGKSAESCATLCDISNLTCSGGGSASNSYPSQAQWTDAACFTFNTGNINAYDASCGGQNVIIPKTINSEVVVALHNYTFAGISLNSIRIPNSVTFIGQYVFENNNLSSIIIPNSVSTIAQGAFSNNNITSAITIPATLASLDAYTFSDNNIPSVLFKDGVQSIGRSAFYNNNISSLTLPDSVTYVGTEAFWGNPLTSVSLKSGTDYQPNSFGNSCTVASGCITER